MGGSGQRTLGPRTAEDNCEREGMGGSGTCPHHNPPATTRCMGWVCVPTPSVDDLNPHSAHSLDQGLVTDVFLPTSREGNVFTRVCDSVYNQPHGYSVTVHPCWLLGHSLLLRGRYASYWNAFLSSFVAIDQTGGIG